MSRLAALALAPALACSGERRPSPRPLPQPPADASLQSSVDAGTDATAPDANITSLPAACTELEARGLGAAADILRKRVAQRQPKMRLDEAEALAAALALLALDREPFRALHAVMPRSTVELARAVRERGVAVDEADCRVHSRVLRRCRAPASLEARLPPTRPDDRRHATVVVHVDECQFVPPPGESLTALGE